MGLLEYCSQQLILRVEFHERELHLKQALMAEPQTSAMLACC
jgi:hypothetical protein